jgi:ribosomal protein S24E
MKGHGKMRANRVLHREEIKTYDEVKNRYTPQAANVRKWFVEVFQGLGPTPEELK